MNVAIRRPTVSEKRHVIRVRTFSGSEAGEILEALQRERFTGNMTVNFSQGAACSVRVEDRAELPYLTPANNSA